MSTSKPCPFCEKHNGSIDTLNYTSGKPSKFRVLCLVCGCATGWHDTAEGAWDIWNTRPQTAADSAGLPVHGNCRRRRVYDGD